MSGKSEKPWREFEELIADLQKGFHPGAKITRNERLRGQDTKALREIDICIRQRVGLQDLLIIVDCKKHSRKVDANGLAAFIGLKKDVAAHAGIIVSEKGFSKAAYRLAKRNGVQALTFSDTRNGEWSKGVRIPMGLELRSLIPIRLTFQPVGEQERDVKPEEVKFQDKETSKTMTYEDLVRDEWYNKEEPTAGNWMVEYHCSDDESGKNLGIYRITFQVQKRRFVSKVGLSFMGLIDNHNGVAHLRSFKSPEINLTEIEKNWERLPDGAPFPGPDPCLGVIVRTITSARIEGQNVVPDFKNNLIYTLSGETHPTKPLTLHFTPSKKAEVDLP